MPSSAPRLQIVGETLCEALDLRAGAARARRRRRQRQRDAGRRAPLVRSGLHRLRAGTARARPRARRRRAPGRSNSARPTSRPCRSTTAASTPWSRPSAACSRPTRSAPPPRCCACAAPAARSAWPTGHPKASSASCSRPSASTCRRRPASSSPALWGTRAAHRTSCSARRPPSDRGRGAALHRSATARPSTWLEVFKSYYGPVLKAFAALDAAKQPALADDLLA